MNIEPYYYPADQIADKSGLKAAHMILGTSLNAKNINHQME